MMMRGRGAGLVLAAVLLSGVAGAALAQTAAPAAGPMVYQQPPQPIADILDAKPTPSSMLSPDRRTLVLMDRSNLPSIKALAEPMLRLAGTRINPRNNGAAESRVSWLTGLSLQAVDGGQGQQERARVVALPAGARFTAPRFSPDAKSLAFVLDRPTGLELWVVDVASARARKLTDPVVNMTGGTGYEWLPDSSGLLVEAVPAGRGPARLDPAGRHPVGRDSAGGRRVRTRCPSSRTSRSSSSRGSAADRSAGALRGATRDPRLET